jgi:hypothetical protein
MHKTKSSIFTQVASARKEVRTWTDSKRADVQLEGRVFSVGGRTTRASAAVAPATKPKSR